MPLCEIVTSGAHEMDTSGTPIRPQPVALGEPASDQAPSTRFRTVPHENNPLTSNQAMAQ